MLVGSFFGRVRAVALDCYLDSCLKRRRNGGFVVVACVVVVGFALGSLVRLRMLCGVGCVLVVLGTVAEVVGAAVDLRTFHDLDLDLVGLVLGLRLLALELVVVDSIIWI